MPASYRIDPIRRVVFSVASGVLTEDEGLSHLLSLKSDPEFDPDFDQLTDFRSVESFGLSSDYMRRAAAENPFSEGSRRGFVVATDLEFGMSRMYQMLTDEQSDTFRVFRSMKEAREWLDLAPE